MLHLRPCRGLRWPLRASAALAGLCLTASGAWGAAAQVSPSAVELEGNFARAQLLVTALEADGSSNERSADLTREATYASSDPAVVAVDGTGRLLAVGNGQATVSVTARSETLQVTVAVGGIVEQPPIGFISHVLPVLSKAGCNAGACHASQYGKGGFKLSVFSFAPAEDYQAMARDRQGRRVNLLEPERSLLLLKPTLAVPHGGNRRLEAGGVDYQILRTWIEGGLPGPKADEPRVVSIQVLPGRRVGQPGLEQQLRVLASYTDGKIRDVTAWARFDTLDESVATVSESGLIQAADRGQATVMARFEGQAEVCTVLVPYADQAPLAGWVENNFVDTHAAARFRELGLEPSPLCDDATFVRRAFLDAIGTLPTPEEAAGFIDSTEADKRARLVDRLLGLTGEPAQDIYNNQSAAWWSLKWGDLLRSSSATIGEQGMWALHNWINESLRENKPFDRFVRELVTATGSVYRQGPANYYRIANNPQDLAETTSQLFLGVRLACAKCHHHPYEKYSQDDYYGFAAFFARVGTKGSQEFGLFGAEQVVLVRSGGEVGHPRTGQVMKPTPLGGQSVPEASDRRQALADWLTSPDNSFFSRNVVNRYTAYLLGRGLVEPIDDMRATNPASNGPLLEALSADFVASGFNLKHLLRTIMTSRVYQLDSEPTAANAADSRFYSHYGVKRLAAEALLDAIDDATGTQSRFPNLPLGTRAIELADANYPDYFLKTFGKPRRASICECERSSEANLAQALHTLNGDLLAGKIADANGRVARLLATGKSYDEIVNELYLATLSRRPRTEELTTLKPFLDQSPDPKTFYEDLLWTLINSKQFLHVR